MATRWEKRAVRGARNRAGLGVSLRREGTSGRSGHTILEILIAITALMSGLLGYARTVVSTMAASAMSHEAAVAHEAARRQLETIRSADFDDIFALYNADPNDDPVGVVGPGPNFAVDGLTVADGDADGFAGEILLPNLDANPAVLLESIVDPRMGTPRDLNGDGAIDGLDHSADYVLLPIVVRVEWRGSGGTGRAEMRTMLADLQ